MDLKVALEVRVVKHAFFLLIFAARFRLQPHWLLRCLEIYWSLGWGSLAGVTVLVHVPEIILLHTIVLSLKLAVVLEEEESLINREVLWNVLVLERSSQLIKFFETLDSYFRSLSILSHSFIYRLVKRVDSRNSKQSPRVFCEHGFDLEKLLEWKVDLEGLLICWQVENKYPYL